MPASSGCSCTTQACTACRYRTRQKHFWWLVSGARLWQPLLCHFCCYPPVFFSGSKANTCNKQKKKRCYSCDGTNLTTLWLLAPPSKKLNHSDLVRKGSNFSFPALFLESNKSWELMAGCMCSLVNHKAVARTSVWICTVLLPTMWFVLLAALSTSDPYRRHYTRFSHCAVPNSSQQTKGTCSLQKFLGSLLALELWNSALQYWTAVSTYLCKSWKLRRFPTACCWHPKEASW